VSLDNTGWVFAEIGSGRTYLSYISCNIFNLTSWGTQYFKTREFAFDATGGGALAYFGHVHLYTHPPDIWEGLAGQGQTGQSAQKPSFALAGFFAFSEVLVAARDDEHNSGPPLARVEDHFEDALVEYRSRYREKASRLRPFFARPLGSLRPAPPFSQPGVVQGQTQVAGATLHWLGLPLRHPGQVRLRVDSEVSRTELEACGELHIRIDGREPRSYPLVHGRARHTSTPVVGTVQADIDYADVQALVSESEPGAFDVCALHWVLPREARTSLREFAARFEKLAKPATPSNSGPESARPQNERSSSDSAPTVEDP
jgi:hypothetical protein